MTAPTRRDRLRTATVVEIKASARRLLVAGGPQAISLRGIARDMGMTAPAIYRYFDGIEALVGAVAGDLYDELRESVEAARDAAGDDPLAQLGEMARAFRRWSVAHPVEFALIFGTPVAAMVGFAADRTDADHPGARLGAVFMRPFVELCRRTPPRTPPAGLIGRRLGAALGPLRQAIDDLPAEAAYVFLTGWTRLYGLISLEVFHQLGWAVTDPEALFEAELALYLTELAGEPAGSAGSAGSAGLPAARSRR